ncbi:MAG TPA: 3-deoxy-7-phosphoheptulonate synthase [Roseiflexaceae bacterium]|nr:3-deoxy-7-phosphoheptulonate synthase [Roseiflexaceae bacterium]
MATHQKIDPSLVNNLHVKSFEPLRPPRQIKLRLPLTEAVTQMVYESRRVIRSILRQEDPRLLVVIGPCSVHDPAAAIEYAERLRELHLRLRERLYIVMRVYMEKPRTTIGWRGLINDPNLDGSFDMNEGLYRARELLLRVCELGLPTATEMLDPISPHYISDLISLAAIGARTVESQTHRALASGISMPVGYKNSTTGDVLVAVQSFVSATNPHSFLGIDEDGMSCVVTTTGNPDGLIILRGSKQGANYDAATIARAEEMLQSAGLSPSIMIDCSHANSGSDYTRQHQVWNTVLEYHQHNPHVVGMMVESNLVEGKQSIPDDLSKLRYGVSITDACIGWEETVSILEEAFEKLGRR